MKNKTSNQNKTLTIILESFDDFEKRSLEISRKGATFIRPINEIVFANAALFYRFMTTQKVEILSAILQRKPDSVFQLAQMVNRDNNAVSRDCRALELLKFIKLKEVKDNRNTKRPVLFFDYHEIVVNFSNSTVVYHLMPPKAA